MSGSSSETTRSRSMVWALANVKADRIVTAAMAVSELLRSRCFPYVEYLNLFMLFVNVLTISLTIGYNPGASGRNGVTHEYIEKDNQAWRIKGTRVALDSIIYQFQQGRSPEAIQGAFPVLSLSQVYGAIAFYLDHQAELDKYLAHNEAT